MRTQVCCRFRRAVLYNNGKDQGYADRSYRSCFPCVPDVDASIAFYGDVLGFTEDFRLGGYVGLKLDGFSLYLSQSAARGRPIGLGTVYVFCEGFDAYFAANLAGKDVDIV